MRWQESEIAKLHNLLTEHSYFLQLLKIASEVVGLIIMARPLLTSEWEEAPEKLVTALDGRQYEELLSLLRPTPHESK